jgi:hypothetical protein
MLPLNPKLATFGRHETFSLRYSWLTKGFQAVQKNSKIFSDEHATIELGVGKNMVNAIKFWLRAAVMISEEKGDISTTELGDLLLAENGFDPYLEDEATLWLIHWQIATNAELATAWFWFFNCFHKVEFSCDEAKKAISQFVIEKLGKHSDKTVQQEIVLLLRMYAPLKISTGNSVDEILDAPLANLKLISYSDVNRLYSAIPQVRENLPVEIIGFAVNEIFNHRSNSSEIPFEELIYSKNQAIAVGAVFRLTENDLVTKLESLVEKYPDYYQIRETAGNRQLYRQKDIQSSQFLTDYYNA